MLVNEMMNDPKEGFLVSGPEQGDLDGWTLCECCDKPLDPTSDPIHTEDGFLVGWCCVEELRVEGYTTDYDSEVFYHLT